MEDNSANPNQLDEQTIAEWVPLTLSLMFVVVATVGVVYLAEDPFLRTSTSLLILLYTVFAAVKLADKLADPRPLPRPVRRFKRLRSKTVEMLSEIKRMNRLAVAANDGIRDPEMVEKEIDDIERHLRVLVAELRHQAGRTD